jgi:hypothetical protein
MILAEPDCSDTEVDKKKAVSKVTALFIHANVLE